MDVGPGTRLGPYTLVEPLGKGASATVYLAHDLAGKSVAVKVRKRGQHSMDRRFLREFESMRLLRIPGVVRVHEAGLDDTVLWFSMELVWGRPFPEVIREEKFMDGRVPMAIDLAAQLFEILARLHDAGFLHRDVKPSNVLVTKAGEVRVLDFGIGRYFTDSDTLSQSGEVLGTVPFMAPEQIAGLPIDARVDLFAAGVMLYESLIGKRPRPSTTVGWIPLICLHKLVPLACRHKKIPLALSRIVERLTAVDAAARPSAWDAVKVLRQLQAGRDSEDWPEPPFVNPGEWWQGLEGVIGAGGDHPPVWVLEGPTGSGRGRIAEQLHRLGILQGVWPIHVSCNVAEIGGALAELLEILLTSVDDEDWGPSIVADDADALRRMWPHLHLPGAIDRPEVPTSSEVAEAVAKVIGRASKKRPLLLVFHDLEGVDALTARAILRIALHCGEELGMLLIHESRWKTPQSQRIVAHLQVRNSAGWIEVPPLSADQALEIASSLCPEAPAKEAMAGSPQLAVETGLKALAKWRGQEWPPIPAEAWPLAVRASRPAPEQVVRRLVRTVPETWVRRTETGLVLSGGTAADMARARLQDLRSAALQLATAWAEVVPDAVDSAEVAALRLLGQDLVGAWAPIAHAALRSERRGDYAEARRWLLVLDTIPEHRPSASSMEFDLAWVRARVALRTESGPPRTELVEHCESLARTEEQLQLARILAVQFLMRQGELRAALVSSLRLASPVRQPSPYAALRALMVAVSCRTALGQLEGARRELERARAILEEDPQELLAVQLDNWEAEIAFRGHDLSTSRALCRKVIVRAAEAGRVRGVAFASSRLGKILRMLGRRQEAEHQTRSAREAFAASGDLGLDAETAMALATLLAERGNAVGARQMLDESIRRVRSLHLDHLMPAAMRVTLQVATLRADPNDAALALPLLQQAPTADPETPAALVRWWRTRGDVDRALAVEPPAEGTYGHLLFLTERARAAIAGGLVEWGVADARKAKAEATALGFKELEVYASMLLAVALPDDIHERAWSHIVSQASESHYTELFLGVLEMQARRLIQQNDEIGARMRWRTLRARAKELGYQPGVQEAQGWLNR